ncbi:MAG: SH3 domain-containing protein [Planktomarina sp.]
MNKFILCTFGFIAWGFWELSGGTDFEAPEPKPIEVAVVTEQTPAENIVIIQAAAAEPTPVAAPIIAPTVHNTQTQATFTPTRTSALSVEPATTPLPTPPADIRRVSGTRVNMRNGPSTNNPVLDKLSQGQLVRILQTPGNGWVKLRIQDTGQVGWMAERLLTKVAN